MDKVSSSSEKGFDSKLLDNESYLKTKLKSYEGKISKNFNDN